VAGDFDRKSAKIGVGARLTCPASAESAPLKAHLTPRDLALTLAVVAVWGYAFVPIKVALVEVPPFALAAVRFAAGADGVLRAAPDDAMAQRGGLCAVGAGQFAPPALSWKDIRRAVVVPSRSVFIPSGSRSSSPGTACGATA
jgi:hypothetical protein